MTFPVDPCGLRPGQDAPVSRSTPAEGAIVRLLGIVGLDGLDSEAYKVLRGQREN